MALGGTIPLMMKPAGGGGGALVSLGGTKSLRLEGGAYLNRSTGSTATTWTVSMWVKRGALGLADNQYLFTWGTDKGISFRGTTDSANTEKLSIYQGGHNRSSALFRDPAAWGQLLIKVSSGTSTVYWNSTEVISSATGAGTWGSVAFADWFGSSSPFYGYISDIYGIEGTALTPTSFAEEDATTGQWKPKAFSGTYGTNGFHLDFKDDTDIGNDVSGNNNDFTATNLAATDVVDDTPTDNYCVYNAVFSGASGLSEGNLKCTTTARGTFDAMSFASYWEIEANTTSVVGGVISEGGTANTVSVTNGSTFGFRLSAAGALDYTSNGSSWTSIATGLSGEQFPYVTGGTTTANFGQSTLSYSVPSGYEVLSTAGMTATIAKPKENFDVLTYSGSGAKTFDNGDTTMQPDFVWVKSRAVTGDHELTDSVRGVTKALSSNATNVESTDSTGLTAFGSDGFTVGSGTNYSRSSMVAWAWKAGTTPATTHTYELSLALTDSSYDGWGDGEFDTPRLKVYEDRGSGNVLLGYATVTSEQEGAANYIINTNNKLAIEIVWDYDDSGSEEEPAAGLPDEPAGTLKDGATTMATWTAGDPDVTDGATFIAKTSGQTATGTGTLVSGEAGSNESYNVAAGFSIIKWSGDYDGGGNAQEVSHSLGVAPELIIAKNRTDEAGGNGDWMVYHKDLDSGDLLKLNSTNAAFTPMVYTVISGVTNTKVDFDNDDSDYDYLNYSVEGYDDTYIAYLFASVEGYSKIGSFSGSSSAFIYTGFRPSFILAKRSDSTGEWLMFDDKREGYNVDNNTLRASDSGDGNLADHIDILSNGFRIRTSGPDLNTGTVIYYAVGQSLKYANAR